MLLKWIGLRLLGKVIDAAYQSTINYFKSLLPKVDLDKLRLQLNDQFKDKVEIYCFNQKEPNINLVGKYELTATQEENARRHKDELTEKFRPNDPHVILVNDPLWEADPINLDVKSLNYSEVCALRDETPYPQVLSAGVVLICKETEELILNRRSNDVATYSNKLHIYAGAYIPEGTRDPDRASLFSTIYREIHEETHMCVSTHDVQDIMMSKELKTGFIQLTALGISIEPKDFNRLENNWEGKCERVPFQDLLSVLKHSAWVPSGKAQVLAWLALGAPNTNKGQKFGDLSAKSLFNAVIGA